MTKLILSNEIEFFLDTRNETEKMFQILNLKMKSLYLKKKKERKKDILLSPEQKWQLDKSENLPKNLSTNVNYKKRIYF